MPTSASQRIFDGILNIYRIGLDWVLRHQVHDAAAHHCNRLLERLSCTSSCPKDFSRSRIPGRISGSVQAAQDISFAAMSAKMSQYVHIVMKDPTVENMIGFAAGTTAMNQGRMFITLKPLKSES